MDLITPLIMIFFGRYFMKSAPKEINAAFGYRTAMSMKNEDTWKFAHKYSGRIWYICGLSALPVTAICMLCSAGKSVEFISKIGTVIMLAQLAALICSIVPTEIALRKNFDKFGQRR